MGLVTRYLVIQDGLSEFVGRTISWLTLAMIAVLMLEIIARYFLNAPTIWAHELSTMLYGGFCIMAGAFTLRHRGHVRSEVIWGMLGTRARATCDVIIFAIGLVVMGIFFKMSFDFAAESWAVREYSNKSVWRPALYPIKSVIPLAVGLVWLQNLAELVRATLTMLGIEFHDPREYEDSSETDPEYMPDAASNDTE